MLETTATESEDKVADQQNPELETSVVLEDETQSSVSDEEDHIVNPSASGTSHFKVISTAIVNLSFMLICISLTV